MRRIAYSQAGGCIEKAADDPLGEATLLAKIVYGRPDALCFSRPAQDTGCLQEMGTQAKANPGSGISIRVPCALAGLGKNRVVGLGVGTEILLNAHPLGREAAISGESKGLQSASHATIAIAKRMDHR